MSQALSLRKLSDIMHVSRDRTCLMLKLFISITLLRCFRAQPSCRSNQSAFLECATELAVTQIIKITFRTQRCVFLIHVGVEGNITERMTNNLQQLEAMLSDFRSRLWLTYRKDFPPLGEATRVGFLVMLARLLLYSFPYCRAVVANK